MLLLSQRGQPQKWYNQYGNVSCNTVCQLFNQPTKKRERERERNQKVHTQSLALSSRPVNFIHICIWLYIPFICQASEHLEVVSKAI